MSNEKISTNGGRRKGAGRKKGVPNKNTTLLKDAIMCAFDEVGGQEYLQTLAIENPTVFAQLLGKVLPLQVNANIDTAITHKISITPI